MPRLQLQVPLRPGARRPHATGAQFNCFYDFDDLRLTNTTQLKFPIYQLNWHFVGVAPRQSPAGQLSALQRAAPLQRGRRPLRRLRGGQGVEDGALLQVQGQIPQTGRDKTTDFVNIWLYFLLCKVSKLDPDSFSLLNL